MDPKILARYLQAIADDMEDMAPDYEPVFTDVYQYYENSLASFTNTIDDLILQTESSGTHVTLQCGHSTSTIRCRNLHRRQMRVHSNITQNYIALTESNYVPLCSIILVHMIDEQDAHIFKFHNDYAQNKRKFLQHLKYAET